MMALQLAVRTLWLSTILCMICVRGEFNVGVGIADVTGPAAEINFMGYANLQQSGKGIHLRQFARAFIFEQLGTRLAFVSIDIAMLGNGVRREVLRKLRGKYGSIYNVSNVILSATHSHSTPGGHMMEFIFDVTILGFVKETFNSLVAGITRSIVRAHENIQPARLFYSENSIIGVNINRSPTSYLANPQEERDNYEYDVDKKLTQLKIVGQSNEIIGVINWFAVHPTSMNNTNKLISSDNVGYASILMEKALNPKGTLPGKGKVVAAVASSNLGDVSPNVKGPHCEISRKACDLYTSRCPELSGSCFASGPGKDMFESTKIIAKKISEAAIEIINDRNIEITGRLQVIQQFVDMPNETVSDFDPVRKRFIPEKIVRGCLPAMGYSFAAGTTDGPGAFTFAQGTTSGNKLWDSIRDFLAEPTQDDIACQYPKPILFDTGRIKFPYEWQPKIVSTQMALIGNLAVAAVPGEFTTMSGRRLRQVVKSTLEENGRKNVKVVLSGLANTYADYITTFEEYQLQRYEAASTIYGPNTLTIYLNKYRELARALATGTELPRGPIPPNLSNEVISLVPPVLYDAALWKADFGDVVTQPKEFYHRGETAKAVFVSGHPRNNMLNERWFAAVEMLERDDGSGGRWKVIATDASWETKFIWERSSKILGTSNAEVYWEIPYDTPSGTYRIHHYGFYKYLIGNVYPYEGVTNSFEVTDSLLNM